MLLRDRFGLSHTTLQVEHAPGLIKLAQMKLEGKTAIVTGASSGIGAAVVRDLRAWESCRGRGGRVERIDADVALELDVTDAESCERFVEAAVEALGGLDILFNNAGLALGRIRSTSRPRRTRRP